MSISAVPTRPDADPGADPAAAPAISPTVPATPSSSGDIVVRLCAPGRMPERLDAPRTIGDGQVCWVDVEADVDPSELLAMLHRIDPGLDVAFVENLLDRDDLLHGSIEDLPSQTVSLVGWGAEPPTVDGALGAVVFQQVEVFAAPGLVVSCWHHSQRCTSEGCEADDGPVWRGCTTANVERRWARGSTSTSGDLATTLAEGLTSAYRHGCRTLEDWLQDWESTSSGVQPPPDTGRLEHLLGLANQVRRRLAAFEQQRTRSGDSWFEDLSEPRVDGRVVGQLEATQKQLRLLFESIRSDMELATMRSMQHQAEVSSRTSRAQAKFEERLGWVTALLLVPTLITGFFGANTRLPGGGSWHGFEVMVLLILLSSLAAYLLLVHPDRSALTTPDRDGEH